MAEKFTAKQFIDAIAGTGGVISEIASRVGCSWNTARKYIDKYATVKAAWQEERERITDKARSNIITAIEDDKDLHMSKWWLQVMDDEFKPASKLDVTSQGEKITSPISGMETLVALYESYRQGGLAPGLNGDDGRTVAPPPGATE